MEQNSISTWNITTMPECELLERRKKILTLISKEGAEAIVLFGSKGIHYLTGGTFIPTERPIVLVLKCDGETALLVPRLELEYASKQTKCINTIEYYTEYPGPKHPMVHLADLLKSMDLNNKCVVSDSDGYGSYFGYVGPKISEVCHDIKLKLMPRLIEEIMKIKTPYEQALIKESARWANYAHTLLQEYTKAGLYELDVVNRANNDAMQVVVKTLGPEFSLAGWNTPLVRVHYRGQIGKNSYYPHTLATNAMFCNGDNLITGATASVLGYNSELERTLFVGDPSSEQVKFYNHALELQKVAFNTIKAGKKCSDVDKEVVRYYKENNLMDYWRHHTGHALGISNHESPFFDSYDDSIIEPGMVFSVEPGLYVKNLGGFRLSDTILVTDRGIEMITYYPKDIEKMVCR